MRSPSAAPAGSFPSPPPPGPPGFRARRRGPRRPQGLQPPPRWAQPPGPGPDARYHPAKRGHSKEVCKGWHDLRDQTEAQNRGGRERKAEKLRLVSRPTPQCISLFPHHTDSNLHLPRDESLSEDQSPSPRGVPSVPLCPALAAARPRSTPRSPKRADSPLPPPKPRASHLRAIKAPPRPGQRAAARPGPPARDTPGGALPSVAPGAPAATSGGSRGDRRGGSALGAAG